ncbi:hypothetical protein CWB96_17900 [Pseudoalteromonas citrea]|uniref:Uncharacterized protein n=1 Tax=Pseudoalteromonas citrea TaxID=43655 RepID=A0A5S3XM62_9GAMM|nr:hypothetical protein [Pseudoalteromonas citrea]TMP41296.1 hypothetical protein CWB97_15100 [Pseudoalteromonas citrea]TMP55114.1 hypothetical protein CWB96_17900 [Pseudoalteromonas citrea]
MNKAKRVELLRLFSAASRFESRLKTKSREDTESFITKNYHWLFLVSPFAVSVILAFIAKSGSGDNHLRAAALILLLVAYFAAVIQPFLMIWIHRQDFINSVRSPMSLLMKNIERNTLVDSRLLSRLRDLPIGTLDIVLLELRSEKEFFEKRIALVVGTIEKFGLIPGIFAVLVALSNVKADKFLWLDALAYAVLFLYGFGVAAHHLAMRLERYSKVVELVLESKKPKN